MTVATLGQRFSLTVVVSAVVAFTAVPPTEVHAQGCGNGVIDSGEQCDPPGSITCPPGSPAGAFLPCNADCTCGSPDGALLDHFKCYAAKQGKPAFVARNVDLVDQFGASTPSVRKPVRFCNPTGKNDEEINDPTAHLACYKMKGGANPKREVLVRNQFGDQTVTVNKAESLCVPAEKNGVPSDLALNHFQCYRVRGKGFTSRDVTLSDQFGTAGVTVLKPRRLCAPVDKNGEGIVDEAGHLMCYRIKQPGDSPKRDLTVDDQFGSFTPSVRRPVFLCVPSLKNPAATTTTTSSTSSTSIEASTSTSSTSTTSTTSPLCGNSMPDPGEQCDPPGSLTCPPTSPGGAFTECAADCSCPGVPTTTTTSSTSTTSTTPPLCGNSMPDPGEQCDPPGSLTCPPTSPGGAFTECAADCSCPGVPTTTSTSSTTSTTEVVPSTTSSTVEPSTTTSTTLEPTTTSTIVTTTTSTSSTSTTLALCCGPERITLTSTVGTLVVDNLAPFAFPSGVTTTLDTSAASGGAECVHDVIVPGGGFSVPNFDIPALNYCSSVTPSGCESGTGQGAGRLWDGNGTPGVALTDVTASADTADGVCDTTVITQGTCTGGANNGNPCVQPPDCPGGTCTGASGCTTAPSGAGGNTLGDIDRTVVASPGGGVRSLIDIPVHSLTWSDSVCSPAITPGCCPTSTYNPGDGDLVITEFDFVLRPSTGTATGLFADKNGNLCKRAGSGFSNPTPDGPQSLTGAAATGPCCVPGQATTVVSVGIGFSGGAPLFDLGFKSTIPNTVASCGSPGTETCTVTTDACLQ